VVPNPALPIAFPGNFPDEFPYFDATATMTMPTGGTALLVHAVTGSFFAAVGNPVPAAGAQLVFSRLRIRIRSLLPFGTSTATHPPLGGVGDHPLRRHRQEDRRLRHRHPRRG